MQRRTNPQLGFTLLELLIAIAVSTILMSAAATAFVTSLRGTRELHDRFVQSNDAQLMSTSTPATACCANRWIFIVEPS